MRRDDDVKGEQATPALCDRAAEILQVSDGGGCVLKYSNAAAVQRASVPL